MKTLTVQLGEVCEINPSPPRNLKPESLCSFVPMEAVDEWSARIVSPSLRPVGEVAKGFTAFAENDVLLAKITPCMENGKCAIARNLHSGFGFGTTEFHVLRAGESVLPEWLFYYWRLPLTRQIAERAMTGSAGQKRVPANHLETLEIPLPSLDEQRRIAAMLEQADQLRRTRRYALELTEDFLPAAFLERFNDDGSKFPVATVEELLAKKPNAIRTGPFGSQLLHSEFTTSGIVVLGIDNAVNNRFAWDQRRFISAEKYEQLKRYTVFPGDVLITLMGTCGRCAIVPDDIPTAINTKHLCCMTLNRERCLPVYLQHAFLHHPSVRHQLGVSQKGSIMDGLNMEIIKGLKIPIPPLPSQHKFATLLAHHERSLATQRESLRQADHLFQSLLHGAFQCEVNS